MLAVAVLTCKVSDMAEATAKSLLPCYLTTVEDHSWKERYLEKLRILQGVDPYKISNSKWIDDVNLWPGVTYIHIGVYLLLDPSPFSSEELLNYNTLASYVNFISGVKVFGDKSPHWRIEFYPSTLSRNITVISYVWV